MKGWSKETTLIMWSEVVNIFKSVKISEYSNPISAHSSSDSGAQPASVDSGSSGDKLKSRLGVIACFKGIKRVISLLLDAYEKADFKSVQGMQRKRKSPRRGGESFLTK